MPRHPSPRRRDLRPMDGLAALLALVLPALVVGGALAWLLFEAYRALGSAVAAMQAGMGL